MIKMIAKHKRKALLKSAAKELKLLIDDVNVMNLRRASTLNLDEPEHHDYQTCYELMKLSGEI